MRQHRWKPGRGCFRGLAVIDLGPMLAELFPYDADHPAVRYNASLLERLDGEAIRVDGSIIGYIKGPATRHRDGEVIVYVELLVPASAAETAFTIAVLDPEAP